MFKVTGIQRFGNRYSCHLQGEYELVGSVRKPYTDAGSNWGIMDLTGGAEE
jgi:hypothetical protein